MDGIINVYKHSGITSFSCVSQVKRLTGSAKAGHAGTLDPEASGVLPVCLGKATKCADMFLSMDKCYIGEITFGIETDTCDIWGHAVQTLDKNDKRLTELTRGDIERCAITFLGETDQVPPDYAAVKINGVPAYKLARQGRSFEIKSRRVSIYEIQVISYLQPFTDSAGSACKSVCLPDKSSYPRAVIRVKCSRGTYIRSLFRDIGKKLGICACMSALERTEYGFMKLDNAVNIDELAECNKNGGLSRLKAFYPIGYMLKDSPYIELEDTEARTFRNGRPLVINVTDERARTLMDAKNVRVYTKDGYLTAFADICRLKDALEIKTYKFFDCKEEANLDRL